MPRAASSPSPSARRLRSAPAPVRELRARGRNTRRKLLDAGAQVFATKGYHATRVDDIVKLAHASHGTFYLYFSNKEELFRALAEEVASEMHELAATLGPLRSTPDGRSELRAWIEQFADLYERYGAVIRTWTEAEIGRSEFGKLGTDLLTQFTRELHRRVAEVTTSEMEAGVVALALVAMLERLNYYALTQQVRIDRDAMIDTLASVTYASLFGSDGCAPSTRS